MRHHGLQLEPDDEVHREDPIRLAVAEGSRRLFDATLIARLTSGGKSGT